MTPSLEQIFENRRDLADDAADIEDMSYSHLVVKSGTRLDLYNLGNKRVGVVIANATNHSHVITALDTKETFRVENDEDVYESDVQK